MNSSLAFYSVKWSYLRRMPKECPWPQHVCFYYLAFVWIIYKTLQCNWCNWSDYWNTQWYYVITHCCWLGATKLKFTLMIGQFTKKEMRTWYMLQFWIVSQIVRSITWVQNYMSAVSSFTLQTFPKKVFTTITKFLKLQQEKLL